MRKQLCEVLAAHAGATLTMDVAKRIINSLFPNRTIPPDSFGVFEYGAYAIQCEAFADVLDELSVLHEMHFAETERYRAGVQIKPDLSYMAEKERAGQMLQFTARVKATGELVGNMRVYLYRDLHADVLTAKEDTFFIVPTHRGGFLAVRLWQFVERAVLSVGVREIRFTSKLSNGADRMAKYLKYQPVGLEFVKVFNDAGQPVNKA